MRGPIIRRLAKGSTRPTSNPPRSRRRSAITRSNILELLRERRLARTAEVTADDTGARHKGDERGDQRQPDQQGAQDGDDEERRHRGNDQPRKHQGERRGKMSVGAASAKRYEDRGAVSRG